MVKIRGRKFDTYQICVTIIEAKHLEQNTNPMVVVRVGNRKKKTIIRKNTDNPYYNEYFVFNLTCNMDVLLSTRIEMAVYLCGRLKRSKFHGSIVFEVATVWDQPDHQYHHKWAMLTNPRDLTAGPRGFVKCNIVVQAKGERSKMPPETEGDDDIEGNLLLPLGDSRHFAARQWARYVFVMHRAEDLAPSSGYNQKCYIRVSFAGMKASTSSGSGGNPGFDERLVFKEMFPPLCHRARISLKWRKAGSGCCKSDAIASYLLNLKTISNSGEYGFLPTFGPSFLHLYAEGVDVSQPIYRGRLLLSVKTEIDRSALGGTSGVHVESIASIIEGSLWRTEEYFLVGVLFDICMIDRSLLSSGKSVSFEISLGNAGNRRFSGHQRVCDEEASDHEDSKEETAGPATGCASPDSQSETLAELVHSRDGKYNYVELGAKKPCVFVKSWWPNTEWRTRNANRLSFIANCLESELEKLEELVGTESDKAYQAYNSAMRTLRRHCANYLHSLEAMAMGCLSEDSQDEDIVDCLTILDRHRLNLCKSQVEEVMRRVETNGELPDNRYLAIAMLHAYRHLRTIKMLCEDPQHALPDMFLWMLHGSRRLAYARLPARRAAYAEERTERGLDCGQLLNLFLERPNVSEGIDRIACKIELFLWLGNAKYAHACWSALPPGYELDEKAATARLDVLPRHLEYRRGSKYQLRAHIFQGRFEPGMDSSGLLDPLVRVIFQGYIITTRVIKQTLDPFWDQTLVFPPIDVHGMREYVKSIHRKSFWKPLTEIIVLELYGRCIASPLVKLNTETYSPPDFPPKLSWHRFSSKNRPASDYGAAVLAALELIEIGDKETVDLEVDATDETSTGLYCVPEDIRPRMASYRMEVIFWGVRDMKRVCLVPINRPKIDVECAGAHVESQVMENARRLSNFREIRVTVDFEMAEEAIYYPPITIKAYDSRGFGCFRYVGMCSIPTILVFMQELITKSDYENAIYHSSKSNNHLRTVRAANTFHTIAVEYDRVPDNDQNDENTVLISYKKMSKEDRVRPTTFSGTASHFLKRLLRCRTETSVSQPDLQLPPLASTLDKDESHDWWSKYYASLEEEKNQERGLDTTFQPWIQRLATFKVYAAELEAQPEFSGFQDRLRTFELRRGKKVGDLKYDENNYTGKFKGFIAVYHWPHPEGLACVNRMGKNASHGLCIDYPSPEMQIFLLRLYVVKGIDLQPNDPLSGKADPYLRVKLGKHTIDERKKYIPNQLNPTFGRVFEIDASFPKDHTLTIQVWDYDATSSDDLIGETRIDIESRFYSQHRAHCGLAYYYDSHGYNVWRDKEKPCQILKQLCRRNNLPMPEYWDDYVQIARRKFPYPRNSGDEVDREESMALNVLHHWSEIPICGCALVPEHIERRPLFNPKRPGLEQGKLEMWIDMFPIDEIPAKPSIDISPQPPEDYELRVIIWNTEDVPLVDNQFLTGEKCSDIYVKGWILTEDTQKTDVHYNSLTGEGNFNWRFVFRLIWARGERMMIIKRKTSAFARNETEQKLPCKLNIQVWDSDHFSKDDFLGALSLDLANMPRGSNNARNCTLRLIDHQSPRISLFRVQRTRAWWPLATSTAVGKYASAGKIEMEMSLVPAAEADKQPVGKGRHPPEALPPPDRPDTSFSWFRNPWKACCFVVCKYYRWRILGCCFLVMLVLLIACAIYAFPGYSVKRLLGA